MNTIYADFDEIVFESREKNYGAYQMRRKSNRYLARAAMTAMLLFLFSTAMPKMLAWAFPGEVERPTERILTDVPLTKLPPPPDIDAGDPPPPPPPENLPPPKPPSIEYVVPVPTPDDEVEDSVSIELIADVEENPPGFETFAGDPNAEPDWDNILGNDDGPAEEIVVAEDPDPDPKKFEIYDKEPVPVNMDDLVKLVGYPSMAKEAEISGKVILRVLVGRDGKYIRHLRLKSPHPLLTKAVEDHIRNLVFTPGVQGGKPVKVWVTIPFDFILQPN